VTPAIRSAAALTAASSTIPVRSPVASLSSPTSTSTARDCAWCQVEREAADRAMLV
jgi:hypothetical protein